MLKPVRLALPIFLLIWILILIGANQSSTAGSDKDATRTSFLRYRISDGVRFGYMDRSGKEVIPCKYDWASEFNEGVARVGSNGDLLLINAQGQKLISRKAERLFFAGHGFYGSIEDEKLHLIPVDDEAHESIYSYRECFEPFREGLLSVGNKDDRWGCIDVAGHEVIPLKFVRILPFSEGLAAAIENDKWGFIDRTGRWAIKPTFKNADRFSSGLALVRLESGEKCYIGHDGKVAFDGKKLAEAYRFHDGLALVLEKKGKISTFGYLNLEGRFAIPPKFSNPRSFAEGFIGVYSEDEMTFLYLNAQGEIKLRLPKAESIGDFRNGLAFVNESDRSYYINARGQRVWELQHAVGKSIDLESMPEP